MKRISTIRKDKYFLTLLCVLVAILMPNEVWAQCFYVSNGTGEKSTNSSGTIIYETGTFANNAGISKIEFTAKKDVTFNTSGISKVTLKYSLDGGKTWTEEGTHEITNGDGSFHSISCSSSENISKANAFQVLTNGGTCGSYKYIISNFNVYVQSSLSVNPTEIDFGSVPVGQSEIRDVEFTYSNIGTIISSNAVAPYSVSYEQIKDCPIGGIGKVFAHITKKRFRTILLSSLLLMDSLLLLLLLHLHLR